MKDPQVVACKSLHPHIPLDGLYVTAVRGVEGQRETIARLFATQGGAVYCVPIGKRFDGAERVVAYDMARKHKAQVCESCGVDPALATVGQ